MRLGRAHVRRHAHLRHARARRRVRAHGLRQRAAPFALTGFGSEPREGALTATEGETEVTIFAKCVITSRESAQVGCAVATQYTIEG